jgi:integrase
MAIHKLTETKIRTAGDGMHGDGGNLWLQVKNGGRSWIFRYRGKSMGLGPLHTVPTGMARDMALECRQLLLKGIDPLQHRKDAAIAKQIEDAKHKTVSQVADEWLAARRDEWTPHTYELVCHRLDKHVRTKVGSLPVHLVDVQHVHEVVAPMWGKGGKIPTAEFVRSHIENILDFARAKHYRRGDNPALLTGPLGELLPKAKRVHKVKHHAALKYHDVAAFIRQLRESRTNNSGQGADPITPYMIEFLTLTAVRKSEMLFARWGEFDLENRVWTVPPERAEDKTVKHSQRGTKTGHTSGQAHEVFLCPSAVRILESMRRFQDDDCTWSPNGYVFTHRATKRIGSGPRGAMTAKPYSIHALKAFLHRNLGRKDITTHGLRTTFRSWAKDTRQDRTAAEMALDHAVGGAIEQIYARDGNMWETRRQLMDAWGAYCERTEPLPGHVISLNTRKAANA